MILTVKYVRAHLTNIKCSSVTHKQDAYGLSPPTPHQHPSWDLEMPLVRGILAPAPLPQTTLPCDTSSSPPSSLTLLLIELHLAPKISKKKYYLLFLFRVSDDNSAPLTKFQLKFYSQTLLSNSTINGKIISKT